MQTDAVHVIGLIALVMDSSRFVIRGLVIVLMTWLYWSAYATLMQKGPIGECRKTATCKCEYENGWVVDLSPLNNSERYIPNF